MDKFFYLEKTSGFRGKYVIRPNLEKFLLPNGLKGNTAVLPARVLNLSYAQYLRYCRDRLGAELVGRFAHSIIPLFEYTNEVALLLKLLNKRMEFVMNEHEFPYNYTEDEDGNIERVPFEGYEVDDGDAGEI